MLPCTLLALGWFPLSVVGAALVGRPLPLWLFCCLALASLFLLSLRLLLFRFPPLWAAATGRMLNFSCILAMPFDFKCTFIWIFVHLSVFVLLFLPSLMCIDPFLLKSHAQFVAADLIFNYFHLPILLLTQPC